MKKHPITKDKIKDLCPEMPGVYKIYLTSQSGSPIHIGRALGVDKSGLIYIGVSKTNLKNRMLMFMRISSPEFTSSGHSGAKKYKELKSKFNEFFPNHQLYFEFEVHQDAKESVKRERLLLRDTRTKFGDTPILNG